MCIYLQDYILHVGNLQAMANLFPCFYLQHKVPLLSLEGLHHLHIFIFVLAIVHVTFSVLTVVFGGARVSLVLVSFSYVHASIPFYNIAMISKFMCRFGNGSVGKTL